MAVANTSFVPLMIVIWCFLLLGNIQIVFTQETTTPATTDDPGQCARDLLDWCTQRDFSSSGISMSVYSLRSGSTYYTLTCTTTGSNGTECKKDNEVWFHCYPDKTLTFKNTPLTEENTDQDVCKARNEYLRVMQQTQANRSAFKQDMERFKQTMDAFQRRMSRVFHGGFPFRDDYDEDNGNDRRNFYNIGSRNGSGQKGNGETEFDTEP